MKILLLTLGHNSSAIYTEDGLNPTGYEEERFTGVKGDSKFPLNALIEINRYADLKQVDRVFISHWFDCFDIEVSTKYWDPIAFETLVSTDAVVEACSSELTHHEAHAWSAIAFAEDQSVSYDKHHVLVIDGFGNDAEVCSLYEHVPYTNNLIAVHKVHGYLNSLGLIYQFAAEYCGMHGMHDVYKFLGYRNKTTKLQRMSIRDTCASEAHSLFKTWMETGTNYEKATLEDDELISMHRLERAREYFFGVFNTVIENVRLAEYDNQMSTDAEGFDPARAVIGYAAQYILERVVLQFINEFEIENLVVVGGCFYNVRLNNIVRDAIDGQFIAMPLAGDQGAAIGMMRAHGYDFQFGDLCWGPRVYSGPLPKAPPTGMTTVYESSAPDIIADCLKRDVIVNVYRGLMEFGPRALCHTSTLALATKRNVEAINYLNGRDTVMPMAPVMLEETAKALFDNLNLERTIGSDRFMITAHDVEAFTPGGDVPKGMQLLRGAMHEDDGVYTARPQIVKARTDEFMHEVLTKIKPFPLLINTSLNLHGSPIVYNKKQLTELHNTWAAGLTDWEALEADNLGLEFVTIIVV